MMIKAKKIEEEIVIIIEEASLLITNENTEKDIIKIETKIRTRLVLFLSVFNILPAKASFLP